MIVVSVFVHQVDTEVHTTVPPGWRWAVHLGRDPVNMDACLNAGWSPNQRDAEFEGEKVSVAVVKALRMCGIVCEWAPGQVLDRDPIPPQGDRLQVM